MNLGKNKTAEAIPDYVYGVKKFKDVADMMVRVCACVACAQQQRARVLGGSAVGSVWDGASKDMTRFWAGVNVFLFGVLSRRCIELPSWWVEGERGGWEWGGRDW